MSAPEWRHWSFLFCFVCGGVFFWEFKIHYYFLTKKWGAWSHLAQTLPIQHPLFPSPLHSPAEGFTALQCFLMSCCCCFSPTRAQLMLFIEGEKTNELLSWLVQTNFLRNISSLCKNWVQQRHDHVRQPPPVTGSWAAIACVCGASGSFISLLGLIWCLLK